MQTDFSLSKSTRAGFKMVSCSLGVSGSETNETQSVAVMEGDSVILNTDVTEIHEDEDIL